jgi:hypothetical protein
MSIMNPDRVAADLERITEDMIGRGDMEMGERLICSMIRDFAEAIRLREVPPSTAAAVYLVEDCLTRAVEYAVDEVV